MVKPSEYTRVIVHQFDPETPVPGGVDTCLRDMLSAVPANERLLVIGVSQSRSIGSKVQLLGYDAPVDFIPVSRADPGNQLRMIPHSLRVAFGAIRFLKLKYARSAVLQYHRIEFGLLACLYPARRKIYFIHTDTALSLKSNSDSFWRKMPSLYRTIERIVLNHADLTIVFNASTGQYLKQEGYRVQAMRTWFNDEIYRPISKTSETQSSQRSEVTNVLWVGRLEAPKDPSLAIDILANLEGDRSSGSSYKLTILGDGTLREAVERRIEHFDLSSKVELLGAVPQAEVAQSMRQADCLLMTSHFEGSPRVMYEALGSGLPVVASFESDTDKVLIQSVNGRSVKSREPAAFASAIQSVIGTSPFEVAGSVASQAASISVKRLWKVTNG